MIPIKKYFKILKITFINNPKFFPSKISESKIQITKIWISKTCRYFINNAGTIANCDWNLLITKLLSALNYLLPGGGPHPTFLSFSLNPGGYPGQTKFGLLTIY
jgi:hypothetical protein